jgi:hypothetical protein
VPFTEATQQKRNILKIHKLDKHLAYNNIGKHFDIAIIEVDRPFTINANVIPAKLPTARTSVGTKLIVSGWGLVYEGTLKVLKNIKSFHLS